MPTEGEVRRDILNIVKAGAPEQYRQKKEEEPVWLREWLDSAVYMAMSEIEAETYPGDSPDSVWADLRPVLMPGWLEAFGVKKEEQEEIPEEIVDQLWEGMMNLWGIRK